MTTTRMTLQTQYLFSLALAVLLSICFAFNTIAHAHEVRPAIIDLNLGPEQQYELKITLNLEARLAGIDAEHEDTDDSPQAKTYDQLRELAPDELKQRWDKVATEFVADLNLSFNKDRQTLQLTDITIPAVGNTQLARDSEISLSGTLPAGAGALNWSWPESYGSNVLRISTPQQQDFYTAYLDAGQSSEAIALSAAQNIATARSPWKVFKDYVVIGYQHILPKGMDHILFVVGLFLLSASYGALLWQVTSFTLAHSVTLALGMLGWIQISPAIVEPLIAASIIYVCLENVFSDRLSRWRPAVIFAFGLLHGLGFAGVLSEIGLSGEHFALGLIAFNVGVELGQLSVILLCMLLVGFWFRKRSWYRRVITIPASLVIAAIGAYWLLERTILS